MRNKFLLTSTFILLSIFSLSAQKQVSGFVDAGTAFGVGQAKGTSLTFTGGFMGKLHPYIYAGFGAGIQSDINFKFFSIPILMRLKTELSTGPLRPFVQLNGGYAISVHKGGGGVGILNPQLGVGFPSANGNSFYLSAGYMHSLLKGGGGMGAISINLGMTFGKPEGEYVRQYPSAFKKFIKKTYLEIHGGYSVGLSSTSYNANYEVCETKDIDLAAITVGWLYPITSWISAGIGCGGVSRSYKDHLTSTTDFFFGANFARIKLIMPRGKLRPFVGANFGIITDFGGWTNPLNEFMAGVSLMRSKKQKGSFDIMLVLSTSKRDPLNSEQLDEKIKTSHAGVRVGWTF